MEQKNCPDPRNCSKIHYFGKCPYKHQPCNRGTSCPYVTQNNCQFYHPEEDYPQYKPKKGGGKAKKEKRKPAITPVKIVKPSATQLASMASKAFAEMAALQKDKPAQSTTQPNMSVITKNSSANKTTAQVQQGGMKIVHPNPLKEKPVAAPAQAAAMRRGEKQHHGEIPIIAHLAKPWGKAKLESGTMVKAHEPERIPEYITSKIKKQEEYIRDLEDRIRAAEKNVELHRRRGEEIEDQKRRFFTCWSRAVKTLEVIRKSGVFLDDMIIRTIEYHSLALRNEENSSIYASNNNPVAQKPEATSTMYFSPSRLEDRGRMGSYQQGGETYQRPGEGVGTLGQLGYQRADVNSDSASRVLGPLVGYHRPEAGLADRGLGQLGYQRAEGNIDNRGLGQLVGYQRNDGNQENRRTLGPLVYQASDGANQETRRLGQLGASYQRPDEAGERGLLGGYKPDSAVSAFDHAPGAGFVSNHQGPDNRNRDSVVEPALGPRHSIFGEDMCLPSLDL